MQVKTVHVSQFEEVDSNTLAPLVSGLPLELRKKMENFILGCYEVPLHISIK